MAEGLVDRDRGRHGQRLHGHAAADGRVFLAGGYALLSSGGLATVGEVLRFAHLYRP